MVKREEDAGWDGVEAGFRYPVFETRVTREQQHEKLACCGIDAALHGNAADPSFFAYDAILAARRAGLSINGNVHMMQRYLQDTPILLGETLLVEGTVTAVEPHPRGRVFHSRFVFRRADGGIALDTHRASLRLDPQADAPSGERKKKAAPDPTSTEDPGFVVAARKQLEPEKVAAFSAEAENLIHSDPEVARRFGFRAPIAGGLMASHFMMEALARAGQAVPLDLELNFLRPMFWDDRLTVEVSRDAEGRIAGLRVVGPDGRHVSRGWTGTSDRSRPQAA